MVLNHYVFSLWMTSITNIVREGEKLSPCYLNHVWFCVLIHPCSKIRAPYTRVFPHRGVAPHTPINIINFCVFSSCIIFLKSSEQYFRQMGFHHRFTNEYYYIGGSLPNKCTGCPCYSSFCLPWLQGSLSHQSGEIWIICAQIHWYVLYVQYVCMQIV